MPLDITITSEEKIPVSLTPVTASGNAAQIDGAAKFEVVSGDGTVDAGADGKSAYLVSGSTIGDTVYKVSADVDLGEGVKTIEDLITVHVTNAEAAALGLTSGAAEPK